MNGKIALREIGNVTDAMQEVVNARHESERMQSALGWGPNLKLDITITTPDDKDGLEVTDQILRNLSEEETAAIVRTLIAVQDRIVQELANDLCDKYGIRIEGINYNFDPL